MIANHTKMHIPPPVRKFKVDVREKPGFSYPEPVRRVKITEHDSHPGVLGYTRHYAVSALPCETYSRHWGLADRFRHGAYTATLQASDRQGAMSPKRSMTLHFPAL